MILFEENWPRGKPVRLIGVGVSNLGPPVRQMRLWDDAPEKQASLHQAVDDLRAKFGQDIIQRARRMAPRGETQSEAEENGLDS
jgi:DNA polymerase-4